MPINQRSDKACILLKDFTIFARIEAKAIIG